MNVFDRFGDCDAHASHRVTGNAVAMVEPAGAIAAVAAHNGRAPHQVMWHEAQPLLLKSRQDIWSLLLKSVAPFKSEPPVSN